MGLGIGTGERSSTSHQAALSIWSTAKSEAPGLPGSSSVSGGGSGSRLDSSAGLASSGWPSALRPAPRRGGLIGVGVGGAGPLRPERALRRLWTFSNPVRRSRRALDSTGSSSELSPTSASGCSGLGSDWSTGPKSSGAFWKALAGISASSCM